MAEFLGSVIAMATDRSKTFVATCRSCPQPVTTEITQADEVQWQCFQCGVTGLIQNWRGTLWDLTAPPQRQRYSR
jgi:hypothetical protein